MKKKLVFSLVLSLILLISVSSTILLIDTSSPVLAHEHGGNGGNGDNGGNGGNGGHPGEDDGGHPGEDDGGHPGDDHGNDLGIDEDDPLFHIEPPEGRELGDVQNIRDWNGDIIVTPDGYPVLGRQIFDKKTGDPILDSAGLPLYITETGLFSKPLVYESELGPGFKSGPGYERFAYTPPQWLSIPPSEDDRSQDPPPQAPIPEPEIRGGVSLAEAFDDDTQFGEPQPVMDPAGNPLVDEDGSSVLGQTVLDEEGIPVIGPNGKPIIVIPD